VYTDGAESDIMASLLLTKEPYAMPLLKQSYQTTKENLSMASIGYQQIQELQHRQRF
jgi:hypothetical protein